MLHKVIACVEVTICPTRFILLQYYCVTHGKNISIYIYMPLLKNCQKITAFDPPTESFCWPCALTLTPWRNRAAKSGLKVAYKKLICMYMQIDELSSSPFVRQMIHDFKNELLFASFASSRLYLHNIFASQLPIVLSRRSLSSTESRS